MKTNILVADMKASIDAARESLDCIVGIFDMMADGLTDENDQDVFRREALAIHGELRTLTNFLDDVRRGHGKDEPTEVEARQ